MKQLIFWGVCLAAAVAGGILVVVARTPVPPSLPPPAVAANPVSSVEGSSAPAIVRMIPRRVIIPAIDVDAPIMPEGTDKSGALEMPPLAAENLATWWDGGAAPGQDGSAVIAGHVDNVSGPLVFWRLRDLHSGDVVETEPGPLRFTVTKVEEIAKSAFPTLAVYGPVQDPELRLITCGGTFDYATGHYLDNVIVFAAEYIPRDKSSVP